MISHYASNSYYQVQILLFYRVWSTFLQCMSTFPKDMGWSHYRYQQSTQSTVIQSVILYCDHTGLQSFTLYNQPLNLWILFDSPRWTMREPTSHYFNNYPVSSCNGHARSPLAFHWCHSRYWMHLIQNPIYMLMCTMYMRNEKEPTSWLHNIHHVVDIASLFCTKKSIQYNKHIYTCKDILNIP